MELWDIFDKEGKLVQTDHIRGRKLTSGTYHKIVSVIVQHLDGDFLLMQRDDHKSIHPSKFELTAGGSLLKGEDFEEGGRRELLEETAIQLDRLYPLTDIIVHTSNPCLEVIFYGVTNIEKDAVRLQEGETQAYRWLSPADLVQSNQAENHYLVPLTPELVARMETLYNSIKGSA